MSTFPSVAFALRSFRRSKVLAVIVVLTLALSIGATTVMFSVVHGLFLAPLPFENSSRLVWTVNRGTRPYDAMSPADLEDWSRMNPAFEQVAALSAVILTVVAGIAALLPAQRVTTISPLSAMTAE